MPSALGWDAPRSMEQSIRSAFKFINLPYDARPVEAWLPSDASFSGSSRSPGAGCGGQAPGPGTLKCLVNKTGQAVTTAAARWRPGTWIRAALWRPSTWIRWAEGCRQFIKTGVADVLFLNLQLAL